MSNIFFKKNSRSILQLGFNGPVLKADIADASFQQNAARRLQAGSLTLDAMFAVIVFLIMSVIALGVIGALPNIIRAQNAGINLSALSTGMHQYVSSNFTTLEGGASKGTVTVATLISGNYLPTAFPTNDPWGDPYTAQYVVASATTVNYAVGTTVKPPISAGFISWSAWVAGESVTNGDMAGVIGSNALIGATTAWDTTMSAMTSSPAFANASAAVVGSAGASSYINDNLYRNAVPGHPEATTMGSDLNVGGNNLTNANDATLTTSQSLAKSAQPYGVVHDGDAVPMPSCPAGLAPKIHLALLMASSNGTGYAITGTAITATTSGSNWIVHIVAQWESGEFNLTPTYGAGEAATYCG